MQVVLFDDHLRSAFLPLVYTRPLAELRFGIRTLSEQWMDMLGGDQAFLTEPYLYSCFQAQDQQKERLFINARLIPDYRLAGELRQIADRMALRAGDQLLAVKVPANEDVPDYHALLDYPATAPENDLQFSFLQHLTDLFRFNEGAIHEEIKRVTYGMISAAIDPTNTVIGDPEDVFIAEEAIIEGAWLNVRKGPVYIGQGAHVQEGSTVIGPCTIGAHTTVKPLTRVGGASTIGPWCKIGGEVSNSIFQGYSNKGHDGYVGNSIIGEWCNLGADTNTSNLKNNYGPISIFNYQERKPVNTGLTFCGLLMGDHSKSAINTMFNTGTVCGVSANVFGGGFPPGFIPSWSWGGGDGLTTYDLEKSLETAHRMMGRRNVELDTDTEQMLRHIFTLTADFRG